MNHKILIGILLSLGLIVFTKMLLAQERTVSGKVVDSKTDDPLVGVNILVKETNNGTVTDLGGKFSLTVSEEAKTLIFRFVGYNEQQKTIPSNGDVNININMQESQVGLNEVVVSASKRREKVLDAPASISVIKSDQIERVPAVTPVDHLKEVSGVDIMKTGLVSSNVNIRGFNNIFSGSMLTIVDNRISRVPSLRANIFQLIPSNNYDIDRIEIVRGPASALYGPNATSGVLHIMTKSPLDLEEDFKTTVSVGGGQRSTFKSDFWHGGKISEKFGYKISGSYTQGHDWRHYDPREPDKGDTIVFGSVQDGEIFQPDTVFFENENGVDTFRLDEEPFSRDFFVRRFSSDIRLDFEPMEDLRFSLNGGFANTSNIELSGLGAAQGDDWVYAYAQARMDYKNLFVQYFLNSSDAGDTYLIPQSGNEAQFLSDESNLHVAQIQHTYRPSGVLGLTYGFDYLGTRPNTLGSINGRFEDDDNINQYGGYLQADYDFTEKLKLLGATRLDYHDVIEEFNVSPRAAIVYKPQPRHTIRGTYNRAFSTPTSLNFFLDLSNGRIPNGINIRGIGNSNGYDFKRDDNNTPMYISPYDSTWKEFNKPANNVDYVDNLFEFLGPSFGGKSNLETLFKGLGGENGEAANIEQILVDFVQLRETNSVEESKMDIEGFNDIKPIESSITQTVEAGYKGLLFDKLQMNVDVYYSKTTDFISPLTVSSGSVIMDSKKLREALGEPDKGLLHDNLENNPILRQVIESRIDGDESLSHRLVENQDGTAWDELAAVLLSANEGLTAGTVTPDNDKVNQDVILTYVNLGDVDVTGTDISFTYNATKSVSFSGNYSFVNKDRISVEGAAEGFIALNAPQHKTSFSFDHQLRDLGFRYHLNWRWQDAFPANSAVFVGNVDAANFIDLSVSYTPPFSPKTTLSVNVSNVLDNDHQAFPGTPEIGRMTMAKLKHTF